MSMQKKKEEKKKTFSLTRLKSEGENDIKLKIVLLPINGLCYFSDDYL